ncbi:MAG: peptidoglycan DD-metalloendopeptidase family protein [Clostridia bacterium]
MKKRKLFLYVALFTIICFFSSRGSAFGANVQEYQDELNKIKEQEKQNLEKLSGVEKEISQDMYEMLELDSKMMKYSSELGKLQIKVEDVNAKLKDYEEKLQNSAQSYNSAEDMYITRLRAIYENGIPSMIDILFSSKGISDFFSRMNVYTSVLEYDKSLVGNMQSQKEYIDYIKKDVEFQKLQLEQLKYDTEKSTKALEDTVNAKNAKIAQLQSSKNNLKAKAALLEKKKDAANKKVEDELKKAYEESLNNGGSFTGGDFAWPVPGYFIITTKYNAIYDPFDSGKNYVHHGVDVAGNGISGKPIVAAQSGIAKVPGFMSGGFGNYVIVNHGKSAADGNIYTTLYGHMSSIAVKNGQYVQKGQVIGYVGSTGWSTGAHLHLEITRNGKRFDALSVYPGLNFIYR